MPLCHECAGESDPSCSFEDPTGKKPPLHFCTTCRAWVERLVRILDGAPESQEHRLTRLERV
jgi:hypothetical protein